MELLQGVEMMPGSCGPIAGVRGDARSLWYCFGREAKSKSHVAAAAVDARGQSVAGDDLSGTVEGRVMSDVDASSVEMELHIQYNPS